MQPIPAQQQGIYQAIREAERKLEEVVNGDMGTGDVWTMEKVRALRAFIMVTGLQYNSKDTNILFRKLVDAGHKIEKEQVRGRLKNNEAKVWYPKWLAAASQLAILQQQLGPQFASQQFQQPQQFHQPPQQFTLAAPNPLPPLALDQTVGQSKRKSNKEDSDDDEFDLDSDDDDFIAKEEDAGEFHARKKQATPNTVPPPFLPPSQAVEFPQVVVTDHHCYVFMTKTPRRNVTMGVCFPDAVC
jgi:hypothetical protein